MTKRKRPTQSRKKKGLDKDSECEEDWCFVCKDGGSLIFCEHEECLKVYHEDCVKYDDSAGNWQCDRHSCLQCHKPSQIYCYCCPNAVCKQCLDTADFVAVRGKKGFCEDCLDLVLLVEEKDNLETEEGNIDLEDRNTHECLFLEYWEIIKEEERLTLEDVYEADAKMWKGISSSSKKSKRKNKRKEVAEHASSDSDVIVEVDEDIEDSDDSENDEEGDQKKSSRASQKKSKWKSGKDSGKKGRRKSNGDSDIEEMGRRRGCKVLEYVGWGSKPLMEFLKSLGKDTTEELPRYEVESIISHYIKENKLSDPIRRRKVTCDDLLYSLFRKKIIQKNKIYKLLEDHFLENVETSEDDSDSDSDEGGDEKTISATKKQRTASFGRNPDDIYESVKISETGFASIVAENIKLVYIRKSLVEKWQNDPESIEAKIVGTFVKIKNDSKDLKQNNPLQLVQVTGVERKSTDNEQNSEVFLKLSNVSTVVLISMLSDADLCEEEIDDLRQKMEKGLISKPTVVELEQKAKELHVDLMNHWMEKELIRLQKLIHFSNDKGRRRELHEYLEQRERLENPAERERLLQRTPKVTPEVVKTKVDSADAKEVNSGWSLKSAHSILFGAPKSVTT